MKDLTSIKFITIFDRAYGSTVLMTYIMYLDSKFLIRLNKKKFLIKKISQMKSNDEIIKINIKK